MGMAGLNRRQFLRAAGAGAAIGMVGGWCGATAAKYGRLHDPSIEVV